MAFHLKTCGGCALTDPNGHTVNVPALSLVGLAFLHQEGRPVARHELARMLWDRDDSVASTNLRSMLRRLGSALPAEGDDLLQLDNRHIAIAPGMLGCDLEVMAEPDPVKRLKGLCELISKGFLQGYGHNQAPLDKWVRAVRIALVKNLRCDFLALCDKPAASALKADLKHAAILLLEDDPQDEEIRQALVTQAAPEQVEATPLLLPASARTPDQPTAFNPDRAVSKTALPRVALLPPAELGIVSSQNSIASALIEDITIGLCASRTVSMVAPYTSEKIAQSKDRASLLKQFDVAYVLDTKRSGDHLYVQLIFMPTDEIIWANRFLLDPGHTISQRAMISEAIQSSIIDFTHYHTPALHDFKANPDAYCAYLTGLQTLSKLTLPSVRSARRQFKDSLNLQSKFSHALAGVSRTLSMEWVLTAQGDADLLLEAERVASIAIEEDSQSAEAFKALGMSRLYLGKIDESLQALSEAEHLSPHYADVLCSHADSLTHGGDPKRSLEKIDTAISLNPISPDAYFWSAAGACFFVGDYHQALDYINRMKDRSPALRLAAACWGMLGETGKARTYRSRVLKDNPQFDLNQWLSVVPIKEAWQIELYREGLKKAGF
ncbi:hypothetical protein [Cohaesibacter intestini]|uniref:hypothetical protein n=1 Tax=Cohaesibacter intestini TaxID=2211145 RepID=UPI000DE91CD7|nr:hypothetical protein [Cohaesibacter intestini]